jgi:zinc transporter
MTAPIGPADQHGLLCGFRLKPGAAAEALEWESLDRTEVGLALAVRDGEVAGDGASRGSGLWLHFNLTDARARSLLAGSALPEQARETLLDGTPHIAVTPAGNGLAGVLGDLQYDLADEDAGIGLVQFYVDEHCLITARRHPLKALNRLRRDLQEGLRLDGPAHLLIHLMEHLADSFADVTTGVLEEVDRIEDRILDGWYGDGSSELGRSRRLMARLRRHMAAQRLAVRGTLARLPDWWRKIDRARLRQTSERIDAIAQDLELVQERARLLQDELQGHLGEATRRNLYFLSVLSAIFLPLTLITGVFGMNVPALPWLEDPQGFWWVMLTMGITFAIVLLVLRWRKML